MNLTDFVKEVELNEGENLRADKSKRLSRAMIRCITVAIAKEVVSNLQAAGAEGKSLEAACRNGYPGAQG